MNPRLMVLGALAAGAAYGFLTRPKKPSCAGLAQGQLAGISFLETVYGDPSQPMPMIVVFHPRGASPGGAPTFSGFGGNYRVIRPQGFIPTGEGGYRWFEAKATQTEELGVQMSIRLPQLRTFLKALAYCFPTTGKPVLTGTSQGGNVTYLLTNEAAGLVGGGVSLLGTLPPIYWNAKMAPTVGYHTTGDGAYPLTKQFWETMQAQGADLYTQTWPGGHSVSSGMRSAQRTAVKNLMERQR